MKSYTETVELIEKIERMKKKRDDSESWNADDEQTLAFLHELYALRLSFFHTFEESKKIIKIIENMHGEMQDEKGMLVY